ncbi:MAG: hypothetical protein ACFBSE_01035 [Prochloraceae cyanobacterium]
MKENNKEKLSRSFAKIASQTLVNPSMRLELETVKNIPSYSISKISLQQLSTKRKQTRRWQNRLLSLDRVVGNNEREAIGKQSL